MASMHKKEFSYCEFTSPLCSWWETPVCFSLLAPSLFSLHPDWPPPFHCSSPQDPVHGAIPQGRGGCHTVTLPPDAIPGDTGPFLPYLSLTEKIRPLSRSHRLLHCLLPGPAHNFGFQNLLRASLLRWFAEYFGTFASQNGKTGVNLRFLACWGLTL